MNEECLEAQQIVSETYDGETVDPAAIQRARKHCTECPECAAFVSTLAAIRKVAPPTAPRRVVQNAVETIRAEAQAQAARTEEAAAAVAAAAMAEVAEGAPTADANDAVVRQVVPAPEPPRRATHSPLFAWGGWAAAAAVVVVLIGIVAMRGIGYITGTDEEGDDKAIITQNDSAAPPVSATPEESAGAADESAVGRAAESAKFITVSGLVYVYTGPASALPANAATMGATLSALDTAAAPQQYSVVSAGDDAIAIVTEDVSYGFELVLRTFRGQRFALQSRSISGFGQWPTLPEGYAEPTEEDGGPTFSRATSDDNGVPVYTPEGANPDAGFAIAPGTSPSDPAAGNPNWTWWTPVQ